MNLIGLTSFHQTQIGNNRNWTFLDRDARLGFGSLAPPLGVHTKCIGCFPVAVLGDLGPKDKVQVWGSPKCTHGGPTARGY